VYVCSGNAAYISALSIRTMHPGDLPPVAALSADVTSGSAPLMVNFDASASSDPDGEIIEYAWDWDGNGLYDEGHSDAIASHMFGTAGTYLVTLRITDDGFMSDTVECPFREIGNQPPVAVLSPAISSGGVPFTLEFNASSNGGATGDDIDWYR
jgi:cellulose 1,4-beta-cellobiosidase